ncbi:unnamed protein product [Boreogadus saida]
MPGNDNLGPESRLKGSAGVLLGEQKESPQIPLGLRDSGLRRNVDLLKMMDEQKIERNEGVERWRGLSGGEEGGMRKRREAQEGRRVSRIGGGGEGGIEV